MGVFLPSPDDPNERGTGLPDVHATRMLGGSHPGASTEPIHAVLPVLAGAHGGVFFSNAGHVRGSAPVFSPQVVDDFKRRLE